MGFFPTLMCEMKCMELWNTCLACEAYSDRSLMVFLRICYYTVLSLSKLINVIQYDISMLQLGCSSATDNGGYIREP